MTSKNYLRGADRGGSGSTIVSTDLEPIIRPLTRRGLLREVELSESAATLKLRKKRITLPQLNWGRRPFQKDAERFLHWKREH